MPQTDQLRRIRFWLAAFIAGLVLSGVTAFPLQSELRWLVSFLHTGSLQSMAESAGLLPWIERVYVALSTTTLTTDFLRTEPTGSHLLTSSSPLPLSVRMSIQFVTSGSSASALSPARVSYRLPLLLVPCAAFRYHGVSSTAASAFWAVSRS
jgi:hypothetical protein